MATFGSQSLDFIHELALLKWRISDEHLLDENSDLVNINGDKACYCYCSVNKSLNMYCRNGGIVYLSHRNSELATTNLGIQSIPPRWDKSWCISEDHLGYWIGYWTFIGETLVNSSVFNPDWGNKIIVKFGQFIAMCEGLMGLILAGSTLEFRHISDDLYRFCLGGNMSDFKLLPQNNRDIWGLLNLLNGLNRKGAKLDYLLKFGSVVVSKKMQLPEYLGRCAEKLMLYEITQLSEIEITHIDLVSHLDVCDTCTLLFDALRVTRTNVIAHRRKTGTNYSLFDSKNDNEERRLIKCRGR
jgi:hypothetical protein